LDGLIVSTSKIKNFKEENSVKWTSPGFRLLDVGHGCRLMLSPKLQHRSLDGLMSVHLKSRISRKRISLKRHGKPLDY
jgi:hypothetical protein